MDVVRRLSLPALLALGLGCAGADASRPPVVLITIDTLRADHLGCYGYFRDTSPYIDGLAADGVLFENAITPMATTLPAHASLMTSAHPARHGVLSNFNFFERPVETGDGLRTAAQLFREAGFATAGFVSSPGLGAESGIDAGFEHFDAPDAVRDAFETTSRVIEWLDSAPRAPFFLWVHYFDPHSPWDPPPAYRSFRSDERQAALLDAAGVAPDHRVLALAYHNRYDGEIRYTDDQVGRLLRELRTRGLYEGSLLVLTSDHGEGLLEHGTLEHGDLYNEQLFVPLVFKLPGGRRAGERRGELASLVDVLPTLVAAVELPVEDARFEGVDLLSERRAAVLSQRERTRRRYGDEVNRTLTTSRWKYFLYSESPDELYDLESDFEERENLIDARPDVARELRRRLRRAVEASRSGVAPRVPREVPPELARELRELGYVE